jgi:hypothetical protein
VGDGVHLLPDVSFRGILENEWAFMICRNVTEFSVTVDDTLIIILCNNILFLLGALVTLLRLQAESNGFDS